MLLFIIGCFLTGIGIGYFFSAVYITDNFKKYKKLFIGNYRLFFGNCPKCNSDAPEMYDCNICDYKDNYHGRKKSEDRRFWWNRFLLHIND